MSSYNPRRHAVVNKKDLEMGRWLDREFPGDWGLFVYFHLDTRCWVIARWRSYPQAQFDDLLNLGNDIGCFNHRKAYALRERLLSTPDHRGLGSLLEKQEYRFNRSMTDKSMIESENRQPRKVQILTG